MFGRHPQDLVKKRIGDYYVERYIRSGSFGHVYEVIHYLLRTKFA